jgi:hypothetical protein
MANGLEIHAIVFVFLLVAASLAGGLAIAAGFRRTRADFCAMLSPEAKRVYDAHGAKDDSGAR